MSTRLEHTTHLAQAGFEVLEVARSISHGDGIKAVIGKGESCAIVLHEEDGAVESLLLYLLAPHVHHSLADVHTNDAVGVEPTCREDGEVARACGYIEDRLRCKGLQRIDGFASPAAVNAKG